VVDDLHRQALQKAFGSRVRFGEPLSRHTSFRIGGPAEVWVEVTDALEIRRVQAVAAATALPLFVLGGGTNVLVSDRGVHGIVLHLGRPLAALQWRANGSGQHVRAGAAASLRRLVNEAIDRNLAGLEFAEGIPGTVGGGLLMNAGAFGGEIADIVELVEGVDAAGEVQQLPRSALNFGYRHFDLPPGFIVTHLQFLLQPDDSDAIRARRAEAKRRRTAHQPLGYPNAGSVFKNPPGQFAARLLEAAGFKGCRRGGAMFSHQHANFIVNVAGATAADVRGLMEEAARRVREMSGVQLEPEIRLVGEWGEYV
jgi:UDP-N-acetylmuramate dehydrogenase